MIRRSKLLEKLLLARRDDDLVGQGGDFEAAGGVLGVAFAEHGFRVTEEVIRADPGAQEGEATVAYPGDVGGSSRAQTGADLDEGA